MVRIEPYIGIQPHAMNKDSAQVSLYEPRLYTLHWLPHLRNHCGILIHAIHYQAHRTVGIKNGRPFCLPISRLSSIWSVVCTLNFSFICAFIAVFVVASMAHLYSQQWKHFENREYGGICTCGNSSLHNFQNLVLLMPPLSQILYTFEFTYSYTSVFVVFIGNNTKVCTVSSTLLRMLRCGCRQPIFCTNASKHLWM
jgi:hypothetical protein